MEKREVRIMRVEPTNSHLPTGILDEASVKLSSIYKNRAPLSGLTHEEEREYLPSVIGFSPQHNEFEKEVRTFWQELTLDVPSQGALLNISTDSNGDPIVVEDWIKYRWAKAHELVADSRDEALGNIKKQFYIYDPEREIRKDNQRVKMKKLAYKEFLKMTDNDTKMDLVIRVIADVNPDTLNEEEKENLLGKKADEQPERFVEVATDKALETKGFILDLLEEEILTKVGNQIIFQDETIGDTMEEAVAWVNNKRNSSVVSTLKAKLKEARR